MVKFSAGATPKNPRGGIGWDAAFGADPDSPGGFNKNAVDVGESVSVVFNLVNDSEYSQLQGLFGTGELALALHAQSIGGSGGYSDWLTSSSSVTSEDIPEPLTILGTGAAVGFAGLFRREKSKGKVKAKAKVKA
ncbi:PEP-CTERM sorting domain-containing protein [Lyngbya aestuarii]|uniref:PEP-CTERM sorting domain-containing protein n=1 Tax=Lyngbya aestuarii TaxID=118322 RepID=UPI00403DE675